MKGRLSLSHHQRIFWYAILAGLPGSALGLTLLWTGEYTTRLQVTITVLLVALCFGFAAAARTRVMRPLQTIANLLAAVREGDYSIRARGSGGDPLGEVFTELNALGEHLKRERLGAVEATALLHAVMNEIEIAVFTFDSDERLRLVNCAGERLLAKPSEQLLGRLAADLCMADCLTGVASGTIQKEFPGAQGRWGLSRNVFWKDGLRHHLVIISDLNRALREEERQAWQRLLRVLGHELNNSLAPIKSIAESLESVVKRDPLPEDWQPDVNRGLSIISSRAEALTRFMRAYSTLARLPQPKFQKVDVPAWIRRVAALEPRLPVELVQGPQVTIQADPDQLDQLLINIVRNAADASIETGGGVRVCWAASRKHLDVIVQDDGPGIQNESNLFVPFFTTKPNGSGIGLVLSRQIAEAHGGMLQLANRKDAKGCEARLQLPL